LEEPPIEEIESVKFFDSDKNKWITTEDLSENQELLSKIKKCTKQGLLARFNWKEGTFSKVLRRSNVSLLHLAVRKANLVASVFIAAKQIEISDSEDESATKYAARIMEGKLRVSTKEKKQKVSDIFEALQYVKPLPDPLPKAFYVQRKTGFDLIYFPATKSSIVREVLYKQLIESKVVTGERPAYKEDDSIPEIYRVNAQDYKKRNMAYGHLVPDANTKYSEKARQDAYLLTNFVPQDPVLNGGLWIGLENKVREMAGRHLCMHVYTGSVFKPKEEHKVRSIKYFVTGVNDVGIPTHLFKVIYIFDYNKTLRHKVYLIPNKAIKISGERNNLLEKLFLTGKKPKDKKDLLLKKYKVKTSILQIQKLSGMNFEQYYQDNYPDWLEATESSE
jgi:DNA/RNA endonuclease G (NUC1)